MRMSTMMKTKLKCNWSVVEMAKPSAIPHLARKAKALARVILYQQASN